MAPTMRISIWLRADVNVHIVLFHGFKFVRRMGYIHSYERDCEFMHLHEPPPGGPFCICMRGPAGILRLASPPHIEALR